MRRTARPRSEQSLARVVVNDLPHSRRAFKDQSEPAGRVAAAGRSTLQHELTGCQGDSIRERTNFNFGEGQSTHGLACRICTSVARQDRLHAAADDFAANERRFRRVVVMRCKGHEIAAVPCRLGVFQNGFNFLCLGEKQGGAAEQHNVTKHEPIIGRDLFRSMRRSIEPRQRPGGAMRCSASARPKHTAAST